jgi:hypothetical protein
MTSRYRHNKFHEMSKSKLQSSESIKKCRRGKHLVQRRFSQGKNRLVSFKICFFFCVNIIAA